MPDSAADIPRPLQPHLLVFPFPAQGHLIPLLNLATHLATRFSFSITVVVTPKNLPLILPHLNCCPRIHPLVLSIPSSSHLPSTAEHVRDLPNDVPLATLICALSSLLPALQEWVRLQPHPPSAILSDFFLGFCLDLALDLHIPHLTFFSSGALLASLLHELFLSQPLPLPSVSTPISVSPSLPSFLFPHLPSIFRHYVQGHPDWESGRLTRRSILSNSRSHAAIFNTFEFLDSPYLTHLRAIAYASGRIWAIGPIPPVLPTTDDADNILRWLDTCPTRSVVYVCFGSQFTPKPPVATALGAALERSRARFLWAVGQLGEVLPKGFEVRIGSRGMVVRGWAPQVAVLGHQSVGAFLTHCGWNSVLEGLFAGVVLLAWPMEADQFVNARLLVEEAGVAVSACAGGPGTVPEVGELGRVIAEAVAENSWPDIRARAADMGRMAKEAVGEGGSSLTELEEMVMMLNERALRQ